MVCVLHTYTHTVGAGTKQSVKCKQETLIVAFVFSFHMNNCGLKWERVFWVQNSDTIYHRAPELRVIVLYK